MSYSKKLEDLIDHHFIDNEDIVKRKRMGFVGYLVNGNMCFGIYNELLVVRLSKSLAHAIVQKNGIEPFDQNDDTPGNVITVVPEIYQNMRALHKFLEQGLTYTSTLPAKEYDD